MIDNKVQITVLNVDKANNEIEFGYIHPTKCKYVTVKMLYSEFKALLKKDPPAKVEQHGIV